MGRTGEGGLKGQKCGGEIEGWRVGGVWESVGRVGRDLVL